MENNLKESLKSFISNHFGEVFYAAASGWAFSLNYDKEFIEVGNNNSRNFIYNKLSGKKTCEDINLKLDKNNIDFLTELHSISDINERWLYLERLTSLHHQYILEDSFSGLSKKDAEREATKILSKERLNIVVVGAGCVGLVFANVLKNKLGNLVNILICENRAYRSRIKKPYSRSWVTNIPLMILENYIDPKVFEIIKSFGKVHYMGAKINMLETLLLISCKNMGVHFYFEPKMDLKFIKKSEANLVIDATAAKIDHLYKKQEFTANIEIKYDEQVLYNDYGFAGIEILAGEKLKNINFLLSEKAGRYYPTFNDKKLEYSMFKIRGIAAKYLEEIMSFVKEHNHDNMFYVWEGKLFSQVNEILILININVRDSEKLSKLIDHPIKFTEFIDSVSLLKDNIDKRVNLLTDMLKNYNKDSIFIEKPFSYKPYIRILPDGFSTIYGKDMLPIGDSLFSGHVKCGNGLGYHIAYVNTMIGYLVRSIYSLDDMLNKAITAHKSGNLLEAEGLYKSILKIDENHADANHNLGVLAEHCGYTDSAIFHFEKAINVNYSVAQYWISLINLLIKQGKTQDAKKLISQAKKYGVTGIENVTIIE